MRRKLISKSVAGLSILLLVWGCNTPRSVTKTENKSVPASFNNSTDTTNSAKVNWKKYFSDPDLIALIETALKNNQELNITMQEIAISKNEVRARRGEYLPFVGLKGEAGSDKVGRFTRNGAVEENLEIEPGTSFPEPLQDFKIAGFATWEIDVWKKLRNAKKSAISRYLASVEGRNFMVTNMIAEIADSYYELMALDNLLSTIQKNVEIQNNALRIVRLQKEAAKVSQLAVNRFEAQLLNTQNLQYEVQQRIIETENRINFLTGRFPQPIARNSAAFIDLKMDSVYAGVPSQLLVNRPDIRQSELELAATRLDVKVARANFLPSIGISAELGLQAFKPGVLFNPESFLFSLAGDLMAPLVNRNAIMANYNTANSKQIQAVYNYERTILNAYLEVLNEQSRIQNFSQSFKTKAKEVEILTQSTTISNQLFNSARADYMEVLLTQEEALDSRMELIEIKGKQMSAIVNMYRALGGGWN